MSEYGQTGQKPVPLLSCDHVQERKAARRRIIEAAIQRRRDAELVSAERYKMYLYYSLDTQALATYREAARTV